MNHCFARRSKENFGILKSLNLMHANRLNSERPVSAFTSMAPGVAGSDR
jgi:hypothetical protein